MIRFLANIGLYLSNPITFSRNIDKRETCMHIVLLIVFSQFISITFFLSIPIHPGLFLCMLFVYGLLFCLFNLMEASLTSLFANPIAFSQPNNSTITTWDTQNSPSIGLMMFQLLAFSYYPWIFMPGIILFLIKTSSHSGIWNFISILPIIYVFTLLTRKKIFNLHKECFSIAPWNLLLIPILVEGTFLFGLLVFGTFLSSSFWY